MFKRISALVDIGQDAIEELVGMAVEGIRVRRRTYQLRSVSQAQADLVEAFSDQVAQLQQANNALIGSLVTLEERRLDIERQRQETLFGMAHTISEGIKAGIEKFTQGMPEPWNHPGLGDDPEDDETWGNPTPEDLEDIARQAGPPGAYRAAAADLQAKGYTVVEPGGPMAANLPPEIRSLLAHLESQGASVLVGAMPMPPDGEPPNLDFGSLLGRPPKPPEQRPEA